MIGKYRKQSGFTLIELLLVIGILGILSVIGLSTFAGGVIRGKDSQRKNEISQLAKALEGYMNDFGEYPGDDNGSGNIFGCTEMGSSALKNCPASAGSFQRTKLIGGVLERIVYLDKFPEDPDTDRVYFYDKTADGYALYASLENLQDKDAKRDTETGEPDPEGWDVVDSVDCGAGICNYKVTNGGLVKQ